MVEWKLVEDMATVDDGKVWRDMGLLYIWNPFTWFMFMEVVARKAQLIPADRILSDGFVIIISFVRVYVVYIYLIRDGSFSI